jgi:peptidyl-prolyl cis-trans isomerase A (cyclophilin A)
MTRWISASVLVAGLALTTLMAQTTPPATRRGAPPPAPTPAAPAAAQPAAPAPGNLEPGIYAHFVTTMGDFTVHLFDKDAPKTVANFVGLAEGTKPWKDPKTGALVHRPYYTNVVFHRIIANFMIQGGDPLGNGTGGPGFEFADEISPNHHHDKAGIVSMANRGPNTNGGQFFITVAAYPSLNGHYSIFGEVVDGLDIVMAISKVPTTKVGPNTDRPLTPVVIKSVKIERVPA